MPTRCPPRPKSRLVPARRVTNVSLGHCGASGETEARKGTDPCPSGCAGTRGHTAHPSTPGPPSPSRLPPGSGVGQQAGERVMVEEPRQAGLVLALAGPSPASGAPDTPIAQGPRRGGQPPAPRSEQPGAEDNPVGGPGAAPASSSPHGELRARCWRQSCCVTVAATWSPTPVKKVPASALHPSSRIRHLFSLIFLPLTIAQSSQPARSLCRALVPRESHQYLPVWYQLQ